MEHDRSMEAVGTKYDVQTDKGRTPLGLEDLRRCTEEVTFEVNLEGRARIFQVKRREKEDLTLGESESQVS